MVKPAQPRLVYAEPANAQGAIADRPNIPQPRRKKPKPEPSAGEKCADLYARHQGITGGALYDDMCDGGKRVGPEYLDTVRSKMNAGIAGFSDAADIIAEAIKDPKKKIGISADYDADGNCSAALFVRMLNACGVSSERIVVHIPNRKRDGYGVNTSAVEEFEKEGVNLMVTLDNGTHAMKPIAMARKAGMQVVVIDHHGDSEGQELPDTLEGVTIVNPNLRKNDAAFATDAPLKETKSLAAVGVSYMMAAEVLDRVKKPREAKAETKKLLGLAALATISDVVPMNTVLNRVLVRAGLEHIRAGGDINILRFCKAAGIKDPTKIEAEDIGFKLGPIINAPGRLGDSVAWMFLAAPENARDEDVGAVHEESHLQARVDELQANADRLGVSTRKLNAAAEAAITADSPYAMLSQHANPYLDRLIALSIESNQLRKNVDFVVRDRARSSADFERQLKDDNQLVLVAAHPDWHEGVIGIAAGRLKEEYGLPTVIGSIIPPKHEGDHYVAKFSARSVKMDPHTPDIGAAFRQLYEEILPEFQVEYEAEFETESYKAKLKAAEEEKGEPLTDEEKKGLVDKHKYTILTKAGGHPMAAGGSIIDADKLRYDLKMAAFKTRLNEIVAEQLREEGKEALLNPTLPVAGVLDMEASLPSQEDLKAFIQATQHAGPYGEGLRYPRVTLTNVRIHPATSHDTFKPRHVFFTISAESSMGNPIEIPCAAFHAGGSDLEKTVNQLSVDRKSSAVTGSFRLDEKGNPTFLVEDVRANTTCTLTPLQKGDVFTCTEFFRQQQTGHGSPT